MSATALIIIDVQKGFDEPYWGARNNPQAEANIAHLLKQARANAFKDIAAPREGEPIIGKDVNSAFIGTDLEARLRAAGVDEVIIAGLTTPHCISTTARMASNLGFRTIVVSDATAAHAGRGPD